MATTTIGDPPARTNVSFQVTHSLAAKAALCAAALLGPLILAFLLRYPRFDHTYESAIGHFLIVTSATLVALFLDLLMLRVGVVRRDGRVLLIAAGFLALAAVFFVHAISTPGVVFESTLHATVWSTPVALLSGAALLALSTSERIANLRWIVQRWQWCMAGGFILWAIYAGFMIGFVPRYTVLQLPVVASQPHVEYGSHSEEQGEGYEHYGGYGESYGSHDASYGHDEYGDTHEAAEPQGPVATPVLQQSMMAWLPRLRPGISGLTVLLYAGAALAYGRRWRRAPTRPLLAITCGALLLAGTTIAAHYSTTWHLSFWLYHVLLLAAVMTVTYGLVTGFERYRTLSGAVEGLFLGTTLDRQREAFQSGMASILGALERRDASALPRVRNELRQRFALADDQVDLLEHAVQLVARERQEMQRLRALAEVGRAASMNLRSAELLANALAVFADHTSAVVCAAGLADGERLIFAPQHRLISGRPAANPVAVELAALPAEWRTGKGLPVVGELDAAISLVGLANHKALLAPMHHRDQLLGILLVQPSLETPIDERLITICRSVAAHLASALANAHLYEELQKEHDDLLRSEIAREQLTQMVVHDLKNPLTGIRVNLDLLHMTDLSSEQTDMVQDAQQASTIILQLISDMLDIARLEEGQLELRRTPTDLRALLEGCVGELDVWSGQENKQIRLQVDRSLPPLLIDHGLLQRVAINLLSNAIKHTPAGTPIAVLTRLDGAHVHLDFHDDGPGIPAERQPYLFERWSTGDCASKQQTSSGLGLTFCKLAVEAHGGSITVQSDAATGTTFTVSLPLASVVEPS